MAVDIIARVMAASAGKNILPEATSEDAGKFVVVDENGKYTIKNIPQANGEEF